MSTPYPFNFPVVIGPQGAIPTAPATLNQQILAAATTASPGLTANLPGILIEDILSTDTAAVAVCDQARVETINSLTPLGANVSLLVQFATIYGVPQGLPTNTSVPVVFSSSQVGYVIANGILVSDGTNTYQVQGGGVILSGGSSGTITAIAINSGAFGVAANTVTIIQTSIPSSISLTVNNPSAGTPGSPTAETYYSWRSRILQAGLAATTSGSRYIKTRLTQVTGVTANLVSVQQASPGIRVIATGANVYAIAYAIFTAVGDPSALVGSAVTSGRNVTVALVDYPNTYSIVYVNTQVQTLTMTVTWNTVLSTFTGGAAFPSLVQPPLVAYINALAPGQVINVLEMNAIFQTAISGTLDPNLLTRMVFAVYINSTLTAPGSGTYAITGDPESVFLTAINGSGITVTQG